MMNRLWAIFLGFMITFTTAWVGLAMLPSAHYSGPEWGEQPGEVDPLVEKGRGVFVQNGCVYCHSQQVTSRTFRSDQARGWGARRTVAGDYRNDKLGLFGTMRTGPDLANVGSRNPSKQWHYVHIYDPQITSKGSVMPPMRYLFGRHKAGTSGSSEAVPLGDGYEIVPSPEARALVAYLLSRKHDIGEPPEAFEPPAQQ